MKKLFLAISILALAACAKTDAPIAQDTGKSAERLHFYGVARVPETRGVAQMDKLWHNGTTILVKFLNGTTADRTLVQEVAAEWEQHANIKFRFVDTGNAHVRIHFDEDYERWVTWSYTGTDCKFITDQAEPTAFFAVWDDLYDVEKRADCRRVFGQILGLELEHRHLDFNAGFRQNMIESYWAGEFPDVVWQELRKYVLDPLEDMNVAENIVQTEAFDTASIMIWPFTSRYATNPLIRTANEELSALDIEFIATLYPKTPEYVHLITIEVGLAPDGPFYNFEGQKDIFADFGNGLKWEGPANEFWMPGLYPGTIVTIWGEPDAITTFEASGGTYMESIFISEYAEIKCFRLVDILELGSLDIPCNSHIEDLLYGGDALDVLDLRGLSSLRTMDVYLKIGEFLFPQNMPALQQVRLLSSPIMDDETLMLNFANALPDMTGSPTPGYYHISTSEAWPYREPTQAFLDTLSSKNWVYSSW